MLLYDAASVKAAIATMTPVARLATLELAKRILAEPLMLDQNQKLKEQALYSCAAAFVATGNSLERDMHKFEAFLEDHGSNVLDIAVSLVLCIARDAKRRETWGNVGKVAALVGAAALGAFFG